MWVLQMRKMMGSFDQKFKLLKSQLIDLEEEGSKLSNQIKRDLQKISDE